MKYFTILMLAMMSLSANAQVDTLAIVVEEHLAQDAVSTKPEVMPQFVTAECVGLEGEVLAACAQKGMLQFIYENIRYPGLARENGIEGTVVVLYLITKDGRITDAEIVEDIGQGCGEEVLRIVNLMPDWRAGTQDGVSVDMYYRLPINFNLQSKRKEKKKKRKKKG